VPGSWALIDHVPRIELGVGQDGVDRRWPEQLPLDVVIDLTAGGWPPPPLRSVTFGIWAFRDNGFPISPAASGVFDAMARRSSVSEVSLVKLADDSSGTLALGRGVFATDPTSVARYQARTYFATTHLVVQLLRDLYERTGPLFARSSEPAVQRHGNDIHAPGVLAFSRWFFPMVIRKATVRVLYRGRSRRETQEWRIGIRRRSDSSSQDLQAGMDGFQWLASPDGHFYADPFLVECDGQTWLLIEDFDWSTEKGVIAAAKVRDDGFVGSFRTILSSEGHVSYPYPIEHGGAVYLLPETGDEGIVRLYRTGAFPADWQVDCELYHGSARDTTAFEHEGTWWFFTTLTEPRGGESMLMLFMADSLRGQWKLHPKNPISLDVRNIRSAGKIYRDGARLIRPSQDGSQSYGYAFSLYEITTLTATDYQERLLARVEPYWEKRLGATHTYNRTDRFEVVDGRFSLPLRRSRGVAGRPQPTADDGPGTKRI
jgi:hypothetical protein